MKNTDTLSVKRTTIRICDLRVRTIIGFKPWERTHRQDVVINADMQIDPSTAVMTDNVEDTLDYKTVKDRIVTLVETSDYALLEKLAHAVLADIMSNDRVLATTVRVDKPHALRYARSVSVEMSAERNA